MKLTRGGPTAIAGFLLLVLGFLGGIVGLADVRSALIVQFETSWVPVPSLALAELYALVAASVLSSAIGGALIGIARLERNKEEETYLDPLAYPPIRGPWRRALLVAGVVAFITLLPALFVAPVAHSVSLTVPVTVCGSGGQGEIVLTIPSLAVLVYSWHSSTGAPISTVQTPSGPSADNASAAPGNYSQSSAGWGEVQSNGSAMEFLACDTQNQFAGSGAPDFSVVGTYYTGIV